jgi:enoyl-CoA hydratase/carnithine racemase
VTKLLQEGWVIGGGVSVALAAASHLAAGRTSPAQHQAIGLSLSWLGLAIWAARRPDPGATEAAIVGAMIASMAGITLRLAEWTRDWLSATANRRAVAELEAEREGGRLS